MHLPAKANQPPFSGKNCEKIFFRGISGLEDLDVMPCRGKKANFIFIWDAFVDSHKICSHIGGLLSLKMSYHFSASKIGHTYENVN